MAPGSFNSSSDAPRRVGSNLAQATPVAARPPRLDLVRYRGPVRCFFTCCTAVRTPYFKDQELGSLVASRLLTTARTRRIDVLAYCLMPDHVHVLLERAQRRRQVLDAFVGWKHRAALLVWQRRQAHLWQQSFYDHILRADEDALSVAAYILANPVRAGLTKRIGEYPLAGSSVYSFEGMQGLGLGDVLAGVHRTTR